MPPRRGDAWPFRPWMRIDRGGHPEVVAAGVVAVIDDTGHARARWGDPSWATFLRSSCKMIQALPLVESGAADRYELEPRHLAVCCASHSAEDFHLRAVREILERCGADESVLHCGPHPPFHEAAAHELIRRDEPSAPIHSDCSGKHAGMIATCVHRGWPVETYWQPEHPIQLEIRARMGELCDLDAGAIPHAIDGCGVPTLHVPVDAFALGVARFVAGSGPAAAHADACTRLFDAMIQCPEYVAGTGRICTMLMTHANRPLMAKGGAEGHYLAAWREDDGRAVAISLKAATGDQRSRDFAITEALRQFGLLDGAALEALADFHQGPVRNWSGTPVGERVNLMELNV